MTAYYELLLYATAAFAVALALPAVSALVAGIVSYVRARNDATRDLWS